MYTQYYIISNCISIVFWSFLLSPYSIRQSFLNSIEIYFCSNAAYCNCVSGSLFVYLFMKKQISKMQFVFVLNTFHIICSRVYLLLKVQIPRVFILKLLRVLIPQILIPTIPLPKVLIPNILILL